MMTRLHHNFCASPSRSEHAFSLVELLVTLLIVALLLAILLPALRSAKESAWQVQCQSNQVANSYSVVFHANREDGAYPPFSMVSSPGNSGRIKIDVKRKKERESGFDVFKMDQFVCPQDAEEGTVPLWNAAGQAYERVASYGFNVALALDGDTVRSTARPAGRIVLFDGSMSGDASASRGRGKSVKGNYSNVLDFAQHAMNLRHRSKLVALMADWHVQTIEELREDHFIE